MSACAFPGCGRPHVAHGLCNTHCRQRDRGVALAPIKPRNLLTAELRAQVTAWRAEGMYWSWIGRQMGISEYAARHRYLVDPREPTPGRVMTRYERLRTEHLCTVCMAKMPEEWTETRCKGCKPAPSVLRGRPRGPAPVDDGEADTSGPRCRCGLRTPCNDCLPTSAAAYALNRRDGGDASIQVRSKAA